MPHTQHPLHPSPSGDLGGVGRRRTPTYRGWAICPRRSGYITWAHLVWGHIAEHRRIGHNQCPQFTGGGRVTQIHDQEIPEGAECLGLPWEEVGITQRQILTGIGTSRQQGINILGPASQRDGWSRSPTPPGAAPITPSPFCAPATAVGILQKHILHAFRTVQGVTWGRKFLPRPRVARTPRDVRLSGCRAFGVWTSCDPSPVPPAGLSPGFPSHTQGG